MRASALFAALLLLGALAAPATGAETAEERGVRRLTVLYTSEVRGYIEPCG